MTLAQTEMTVALASDHRGIALRRALADTLRERGLKVVDLGADGDDSVDYPDFADALASALDNGHAARGVLVCGTGIGISIAANRHPHVRAALCRDENDARMARLHNDANVIVFGATSTDEGQARACLSVFLETAFEGGRHERRVAKMSPLKENSV